MIENTSFTIKTVELSDDKRHGVFECEPLERGYGITLKQPQTRVAFIFRRCGYYVYQNRRRAS